MLDNMTKTAIQTVRPLVEKQRERIFKDLSEITSYNSVHSTPECSEDHTAACAWIVNALKEADLNVTEYPYDGGATTVIGTKEPEDGAPTVLLYCHYDVVPAGDPTAWESDPFTLTERNGRWYARGAADCKGNIAMHLAALRAVKEAGGTKLGIKFLVEGSEEQGGAELSDLIKKHPELFDTDVILIADSGNQAVGTPTMTTTLRGGARVTVTLRTLESGVHSGAFGGAAPDATAALIRLLDTLKDEHGRTTIDGVDCTAHWEGGTYDREAFKKDATMLEGTTIMGTENDNPADMVWARPAISIIGFTSTPVDHAINAVPPIASARLNLRVPPKMDANQVADALVEHLKNHVPWGAHIDVTYDDANQPFSAKLDGPAMQLFNSCLAGAYGQDDTIKIGSGGSIPLCSELLEVVPRAELALFGVEDPQATIHSPNESVDPNEIRDIAVAEAAFLLSYSK
ncbi:dipeptidase [Corynebacterium diphtheriae]|uniref:dipeptidase n=1 Tax=Corynebacterium diphtheriae TaxID=1717 RepID=UPI0013CD1327|nr:dipeptidase [Corynebacterium diphtheriae]CAB0663478.1 dipeptidase [Corynebacterium diphtheriae]CAB0817380.1 dipeptidase [Corynebacterium diphtheriae]CAB0847102.1 dipeptidase [Corynebacterium diphtheriae]CAB0918002.1 dipeptidase [Corynebacterium diphtheriae]